MSVETKQINLKDIPEGTKVIVENKIFDGYAYGEIKHRISRSGTYCLSYLKTGESGVIISNNAKITKLIKEPDLEEEYFIHWE